MAQPTNPRYDGADGGRIDLNTAKQWAKNFRDSQSKPDEVRSHYFGRDVIDQILQQLGCSGIRIYYVRNDKNEKELLILGVDSSGSNMLPPLSVAGPGDNSIADMSFPCPPVCPQGSDL